MKSQERGKKSNDEARKATTRQERAKLSKMIEARLGEPGISKKGLKWSINI